MAKAKKFGAFSGVFTPSVLTILGVIMYMRLGWVVGNAGLITALIIIFVSHIISLTTGLSISSVATDKKIKTGGIYYILSRSLGFPMGGSIGIALFTGTALGISLYLVGFAESFLAVDAVRNYLHLEQDINSYRLVASTFLLLLVIIALISTSLAIKAQYFILAAIALSLVSIIVGLFTGSDTSDITISISPARTGVSTQEIFGVFFPAVTGFTAGVAMSGDLKNPKKDIPVGTLSAIIVGFVVYVGLAILFGFFVDRELLINDYNFLMNVSWFAPLVIVGIWGATLSSALGGILGGPRILQAISKDKITPKIFSKGHGPSNEPRNALLFIFVIAEGGILIGELNMIAAVVSMFYLASYGFINLAFFLEKWASTDFRPTFKIRGIVGLIGFIASFAVMAQLGMISMIAALVLMFGLYAWLNRKKLKSESGDVWQSVWLSVVRKALHSLDKKNLEERNWQPNIILFSGAKGQRPYLIDFGKDLVGQYGLLSNFDLYESKNKNYLFPKHLQSTTDESFEGSGVFTRRQSCSDIYTGIETIISTYGFSGIEPNTVLMGWMRQSKDPKRFSRMIKRIYELDVNIMLIDYDKRFGYGDYKTVDIWWRGSGNNGNFALNLIKFLWVSENWSDAKLRLLVGNPVNENAAKIRNHAEQVINNMRIDADIKIINNQIEQKPFYELIRTESLNTDLIILGMPEIKEGLEEDFVMKTNDLMHQIGTVLLIKASTQFKDLNLGLKYKADRALNDTFIPHLSNHDFESDIKMPESPIADENIKSLSDKMFALNSTLFNKDLNQFFSFTNSLFDFVMQESDLVLKERISGLKNDISTVNDKNLITGLDKLIKKIQLLVKEFKEENVSDQMQALSLALNNYIISIKNLADSSPEYFYYSFNEADLVFKETDDKKLRNFKRKKRLQQKIDSKTPKYRVKYKKLLNRYIPYDSYVLLKEAGTQIGSINIRFFLELQKLVRNIRNSVLKLQIAIRDSKISNETIDEEIQLLTSEIELLGRLKESSMQSVSDLINGKSVEIINKLSEDLKNINTNVVLDGKQHDSNDIVKDIINIPAYYQRNIDLLLNSWDLELKLIEFENRLYRISRKSMTAFEDFINEQVLFKIQKMKKTFLKFLKDYEKDSSAQISDIVLNDVPHKDDIYRSLKEILDNKFEKLKYMIDRFPEKYILFTNESFNDIINLQLSEIETVEISVAGFINYMTYTDFNTPIVKMAEELPDAITELEKSAQNIFRRVNFSLFDSEGYIIKSEDNTPKKVVAFINEQLDFLSGLEDQTILKIETIYRKINERLSDISNKLVVHTIINQAENYKRFSARPGKKEKTKRLKNTYNSVKNSLSGYLNRYWFHKSNLSLFKINENNNSTSLSSSVNKSLDLIDNVTLSKAISKKIPFYYQQLFLRSGNLNNRFFFGRDEELNKFKNAIERYQKGYHGALLITGERFSGKTFLTNYSVSVFLKNRKVYTVSAPVEGSVSVKTFKTKLAKALNISGNYSDKFSALAAGSVIIIEDLELWWEKSDVGSEVIKEIIDITEQFGKKFLFILNVNSEAFKLINKTNNIEQYFLDIVECKPFNAKGLTDVIMFRHNSSGFKLNYRKKTQERFRQSDLAKLFSDFFKYSEGNVGVALNLWLANIKDFEDDIVYIDSLKNDLAALTINDHNINLILTQFILHKRLTVSRLSAINMEDEELIKKQITYLKRSGIITEETKSVFEINKFLYFYVKKHLKRNNLM